MVRCLISVVVSSGMQSVLEAVTAGPQCVQFARQPDHTLHDHVSRAIDTKIAQHWTSLVTNTSCSAAALECCVS
jgi:hypothetical protein